MVRARLIAVMLGATVMLWSWSAASRAQAAPGGAADLVLSALGLLGTPYRYGGDQPAYGFDCSGLVAYVARSVLGVELPRRAEAISRVGVDVNPLQLQPGDLVFFNTLGRPFSHVGFYLGDGQFLHAPAQRGQVRIEQMSQPYWRARFSGARRLEALLGQSATGAPAGTGPGEPFADAPYVTVEP